MKRYLFAAALLAVCASLLPAEDKKAADPKADDFKPLFNGKNLDGWVNVNCHPGTFFVKGDEIVTTGQPTGFLRSDRQYENFVLEFDWMHVEKEKMANSGLFVWGDPLPAVGTPYTRGIEVQVLINFAPKDGWATSHGDIFSIHGARCTPDRAHPVNPKMERCLPSENRVKGGGEWNHYKVTANDGAIKLEVNGKEVSGVSKSNPRKGYLALESEGAECHFKNIKLKELPSTNPKPEECAKVADGHVSIFNGLDLKGWTVKTSIGQGVLASDNWKATGGHIRSVGDDFQEWLWTDKAYGRYELIYDFKLPEKSKAYHGLTVPGGHSFSLSPDGFVGSSRVTGAGEWIDKDAGGVIVLKADEKAKPGSWVRVKVRFDGKTLSADFNGRPAFSAPATKEPPANPFRFAPIAGLEIMNVFLRELKEEKK